MSNINKRRFGFFIAGLIALCAALIVIVFIPFVIDKMFEREVQSRFVEKERAEKVVTDWGAEHWSTSPDRNKIEADVFGKKQLEAVFVKDWTVSGLAPFNGTLHEIKVEFLKDQTPGSTRPAGTQSFGRWKYTAPEGMQFETGEILIVIIHNVAGKITVTEAGPFQYVAPPT